MLIAGLRLMRSSFCQSSFCLARGHALLSPRPSFAFFSHLPSRPASLLRSPFPCRATAEPRTKMGRLKSSVTFPRKPPHRESASAPPPSLPPPQFQPLHLDNGRVCTPSGLPILEGVTPQAWVTSEPGSNFLVLGMEAAGGAAASMADFPLGLLRCRRWLACARNKLWWMTPEWGENAAQLPPETQFLLLELPDDGGYAILLPLINEETFRGTLRPPKNSGTNGSSGNGRCEVLYLRMESGDETVMGKRWPHALLMASGDDPYALIEAAVPEAAALSGGAKPLREKKLPASIDVFGWCSWDAFYSSVSAQGLVDAVASLNAGGVPPKLVIIDDGWQSTDLDRKFKGWQDPGTALLASAKERLGTMGGSFDSGEGSAGADAAAAAAMREKPGRECYIEGESEAISAVLRDIPAGTATGALLQEVKAAEDDTFDNVDYYTIAQQHDATTEGGATARQAAMRGKRHATVLTRASSAVIQYVVGLVAGVFQALILVFYQKIVDPAEDGTWPVRFFEYLTSGPLRDSMLQFYADQTNFTRRLVDVKANSKFHSHDATPEAVHSGKPENLAAVVSHLREHHSVQYIYCWHGLSAYWSGVAPDAPAMQRYRPSIVHATPPPSLREIEPSLLWNPSVLAGLGVVLDPDGLFRDMHSYLAGAGVTGVKVDCQAGVGMMGSVTGGGPAVAARYHAALEDSVADNFPGNDVINCMCHSTENIYRWRGTAVARASDDFYPSDTASHTPHIAACAFNGLFLSALAQPDFDMFHSKHVVAGLHAAARAVSGGPVYVSDAPGHHGFDILRQLVLPDGSVLRALLPGRPTRDCLFLDPLRDAKSLLKIWNANEATGVVGVFNLQGASWDRSRRRFAFHSTAPPRLTTTVRVVDVETMRVAPSTAAAEAAAATSSQQRQRSLSPTGTLEENANGRASSRSPTPSEFTGMLETHLEGGDTSAGYDSDVSSGEEGNTRGGLAAAAAPRRRCVPAVPAPCGDVAAFVNTTGALLRLPADGEVQVELESAKAAVVTFAKICSHHGVDFAPLGLKNMLNGGGAVTFVEVEADRGQVDLLAAQALSDTGNDTENYADLVAGELNAGFADEDAVPAVLPRFHVGVKGRGTLLALCSREPVLCSVDGYEVRHSWKAEEQRLEVEVPQVGKHTKQHLVVQFR